MEDRRKAGLRIRHDRIERLVMDPDAAMEEVLTLLQRGDMIGANLACVDLIDWLGKGGHLPARWRENLLALHYAKSQAVDDMSRRLENLYHSLTQREREG